MRILVEFLTTRAIRPLDLFRSFTRESDREVTRAQFIRGLKVKVKEGYSVTDSNRL